MESPDFETDSDKQKIQKDQKPIDEIEMQQVDSLNSSVFDKDNKNKELDRERKETLYDDVSLPKDKKTATKFFSRKGTIYDNSESDDDLGVKDTQAIGE